MKNTELLKKFIEAENKRDWETFAACLHPEVMWFLHGETSHLPIAGREDCVKSTIAGYQNTNATLVCENMMESKSGNRIIATLRNSYGVVSVEIFDFEDGLIRWEHEFLLD